MFIEVKGKQNSYMINSDRIELIGKMEEFTIVRMIDDPKPIWLVPGMYEVVRNVLIKDSNDLKETKQIQPKVTTRRGKQHDRNYHKPAQIPVTHLFVLQNVDNSNALDQMCKECNLPFNHPSHNISNPIEISDPNNPIIGEVNVNQPEATRTDRRDTDVTR